MVDLDTRLLRAFVTVAEELNFTRAAERLHLAQQALSAQIRQLEEPVRSFFGLMQLPTAPLPVEIGLDGTLAQPRLTATAPPDGR